MANRPEVCKRPDIFNRVVAYEEVGVEVGINALTVL
jgi:hypothetical protein